MISQASARLYISEFLADNSDGLLDSDGDPSDWIEVFNSGSQAVDLGGYYLTDNPSFLTKWPFPSLRQLPSQSYPASAYVHDPSSSVASAL